MEDCMDEKESLICLSNQKPAEEHQVEEVKKEEGGDGHATDGKQEESGGGFMASLVSNLGVTISGLSSPRGEHKSEEAGGLINHLISSLPASTPLSDEQSPAADEASLLISIIED